VCHQTVSLVSRHLEAAGISTVVVGSARDIVEECGVARLLFVDFPLGNSCGKPGDRAMQQAITSLALDLIDTAIAPRTTVQAPVRWESDNWRTAFMEIGDHNIEALRAAGAKRREAQATS
jgi:D-proline reductase (dithiol) PrdB